MEVLQCLGLATSSRRSLIEALQRNRLSKFHLGWVLSWATLHRTRWCALEAKAKRILSLKFPIILFHCSSSFLGLYLPCTCFLVCFSLAQYSAGIKSLKSVTEFKWKVPKFKVLEVLMPVLNARVTCCAPHKACRNVLDPILTEAVPVFIEKSIKRRFEHIFKPRSAGWMYTVCWIWNLNELQPSRNYPKELIYIFQNLS